MMRLWSAKQIKYTVCILTPFLLLPLAISQHKEARCAFVIIWMAVYWMLEPVHLTVTALLPVPLMPLLGILSASEVSTDYMKEVLMMFLGGLAVAVAVEHCRLHERIALRTLLLLGTDTKWLLLGFMLSTMFLSMWISNTATTAMMVPIVNALMAELKKCLRSSHSGHKTTFSINPEVLHTTLLLGVAYSANCGGTGTITGTSPNMVLKGFLEDLYPGSSEITYATWMGYNVPGMIICVFMAWIILQLLYVPCWRKQDDQSKCRIRNVILSRYRELGKITFHESAVLVLFVTLVFLWIFRDPKFMNGWANAVSSGVQMGDSVPVILILFVMFMVPAEPWKGHESPALLQWDVVQSKLPWGLVFLLGGGFALAHGTQKSGLSLWLGARMTSLSFLSPGVVLVILCISTALLTEVISNSTVATILLPVVSQMANAFKVNPLYLMLPVTICSSYAFMLPVATGPNAIVFDTGYVRTINMVKSGILMNMIACIVQLTMINTLGVAMFGLNEFPAWGNGSQTEWHSSNTLLTNVTSQRS